MADVRIDGLADLHKLLQELPAKVEANVLRGGLRAGAKVIEEEAKRLVPVKDGDLRASVRVSVRSRRGRVTAEIKAGNKKAFYAHMVEGGTVRHLIRPKNRRSLFFASLSRKQVNHPGALRKPFMRPALDGKSQAAVEKMAEYIRQRLPKEFKKAKK